MLYQLRPVQEGEYDLLFAIKKRAFSEYVIKAWGAWDDAVQDEFFRPCFEDPHLRVVEVEGQVAGMLSCEPREGTVFLSVLYLDIPFQGKGLGSALVKDLLAEAQANQQKVQLHVLECNTRARSLYERFGFRVTGPGQYEHSLMMEFD